MKRLSWVFVVLGLCSLLQQSVFSDGTDIEVTAEINNAFATIGDRLEFQISVNHNPEIQVLQIDAANALADFEIKETTPFKNERGDRIIEGKRFSITCYDLGEYVIRPVTITYIRKGSGTQHQTETNQLYVTIQSINSDKDAADDIRGIKGVLQAESSFWKWLLGLFVFLALVSALLIFFILKKRKQLADSEPEPLLTPHDEAYRALIRLQDSDLLKRRELKKYFLLMSEILRRYFERRYVFPAMESTTAEILQSLRELVSRQDRQLIEDVLAACDLVKFAKWEPQANEILHINKKAKEIIDKTRTPDIPASTGSEPVSK